MINAGAIVTSDLIGAPTRDARYERIRAALSAFAGRELDLDERVYASESATGHRNRALATTPSLAAPSTFVPPLTLDLSAVTRIRPVAARLWRLRPLAEQRGGWCAWSTLLRWCPKALTKATTS
jgi:hypothetical protein